MEQVSDIAGIWQSRFLFSISALLEKLGTHLTNSWFQCFNYLATRIANKTRYSSWVINFILVLKFRAARMTQMDGRNQTVELRVLEKWIALSEKFNWFFSYTGPLSSPLSSTSKSYLMLFATQPQICIGRKANSICFFDNECRSCQHFHSFEIIEELQLFYTVKVLKSQFSELNLFLR